MLKLSRQEEYILLFLILAILIGSAVILMKRHTPPPIPEEPRKIVVHITGAVNKPGVYEFDEEARIIDAIKAAGGAKEGAILDLLNLAQPLINGSKIVVPQKSDEKRAPLKPRLEKVAEAPPAVAPPTPRVAPPAVAPPTPRVAPPAVTGKININTATQAQLETLPGIGPKRAEAIIACRPYSSPEEITKVHGIGPKIYEALKDKITVK